MSLWLYEEWGNGFWTEDCLSDSELVKTDATLLVSLVSICINPETGLHDSKHWPGPSSFLRNRKNQLQRRGRKILTKRRMQRMRHWLVLGKHLGWLSISYTVCFTPALLNPGCAPALWKWFWLKQMMFLTYGCVKIQIEPEGLPGSLLLHSCPPVGLS